MIWDRERYIAHALHQYTGREMFCELFGPLHMLENEWRAQGASDAEISMKAFDWDYVPVCGVPANTGAVTGIRGQILSDTPELQLAIDGLGRHTKLVKKSATIPLPMDYPVVEPEDWEKIRHWYAFRDDRIQYDGLEAVRKKRDAGALITFGIPGAFDEPRQLLGEAGVCLACYEEPEMLHDMLDTITDTCLKTLERVASAVQIDCITIHEDMAGKSGPLWGPPQIREFFYPYYRKIWDAAQSFGVRLFSQDSDGDISQILDELVACGLNCIHPCQPVGGMDIVKLHEKYGNKLCLKGGIDKFALRGDKNTIRAELEKKIVPALCGGGTVFGLDHRIPNGVPIENYRYYVTLGREMLGLPPISEEGWGRMAF